MNTFPSISNKIAAQHSKPFAHSLSFKALLLTGLLIASTTPIAFAAGESSDQWPQWRGPNASGVAPAGNPPVKWSETENVKWKVKLPGSGAGTPIIWGKQIFVQSAIPTGKKSEPTPEENKVAPATPNVVAPAQPAPADSPAPDGQRRRRPGGGGGGGGGGGFGGRGEKPNEFQQFALLALDRETGKILWQKTVREELPHEGHHRDHGFASHSPVTDGEHVYSWFGSRGLHCFDMNGVLKWEKDFGKIRAANGFGEGTSPALYGDTLVINWDHEGEDFIAALDKKTGRELWRQPRDEKTTWTTPLIINHGGKAQVVVSASQRIRSYDLASGKQIWECGGLFANVIPTPVSDDTMVYAMNGFRGNALLAIKLGKTGDLTGTDAIAWQQAKSTPYVPSPLLYNGRLWFLAGNNAILSCVNAKTGDTLISEQRLEGTTGFYASPVGASGRVYLAGRNGTSVVLKDGDKFEVLATNVLDEKFDASPAIVGNEIYLRGHGNLYCLTEKK